MTDFDSIWNSTRMATKQGKVIIEMNAIKALCKAFYQKGEEKGRSQASLDKLMGIFGMTE